MKLLLKATLVSLILCFAIEVDAACSVSTTGVSFGTYDSFNLSSLDATGTISVSCDSPPAVDVTVSIDQSFHSGLFDPRQMKNTSDSLTLNYNLYIDAGRTTIWGDGTGGTATVQTKRVPPNNMPRTVTIYGSIPPGQDVSVGSYGDILTVTIIY